MKQVIIGVGPHKLSATIEVVEETGGLLGSGRFTTDRAGYTTMRAYVETWPQRVCAVEGANGAGRPLAQRLLETRRTRGRRARQTGRRARLLDTSHNETDDLDAHSIAMVALDRSGLRVVAGDGELEVTAATSSPTNECKRSTGSSGSSPS